MQSYSIIDLGSFLPRDLNDRGQVVGEQNRTAILWDQGKLVRLGTLPLRGFEDGAVSYANAINNQGDVVGGSGSYMPAFMSGLSFAQAFLRRNGKMLRLGSPESAYAEALGINDVGQIVGVEGQGGFVWERDRIRSLSGSGKRSDVEASIAVAINNKAQIVGAVAINPRKENLPVRAFLWQRRGQRSEKRVDLGVLPGYRHSFATAINDRGQVVGFASQEPMLGPQRTHPVPTEQRPQRGFIWEQGRMAALGALGSGVSGRCSRANGINNRDQVVGQADGQAVLWQGRVAVALNTVIAPSADWQLHEAVAINNRGQILVAGTNKGSPEHAAILTPR